VCSAADKAKYEGGFLAKLNAALTAAGKQGKLTLSEHTGKFSGGVVLEGRPATTTLLSLRF
jgi:V/A-type H+-transporting ATPase subunit E